MENNPKDFINIVNKNINSLKKNNKGISSLFKKLSTEGNIILFGGAVRDYFFNQSPRDYDIVIDTLNYDISNLFENYSYSKNRFGGYKIIVDDIKFDIWPLPSTWAFHNKLIECNIENISKTVFFNIDSIAINLSNNTLYENGFFEAIQNNKLKIVLKDNPCPELCVLRALYFKHYRFFDLSEELETYVCDWITDNNCKHSDSLLKIQATHYGIKYFSNSMLNSCIKEIQINSKICR